MLNAGHYSFGPIPITTALAGGVTAAVEGLSGMTSVALYGEFTFGSGGTTFKAWFQTSFDQGLTWHDIGSLAYTTASAKRFHNLTTATPKTNITLTDGTLADNTIADGGIGDRIRVKYTSTGTYAGNTTFTPRIMVR